MIVYLGLLGIIITLYAIWVENHKNDYKAACDLGENASCSKVLKSPYARMIKMIFKLSNNHIFNVPNTYLGILYYLAVVSYDFVNIPYKQYLLFIASIIGLCSSFILGFILFFKLHDFCVVCASTYLINYGIFHYALQKID